jgi:hypothetical protein
MNKKLNIGCGQDYKEGWWNCDISKVVKTDAVLDIRKDRLPFDEGSVGEIYISGVLEQILTNEDLIHAMNECHRVLKIGGIMEVVVPNARFAIAHQDPMDVRKFTADTFSYFQTGARQFDLYGKVYGFKGWSKIRIHENERHIMIIEMKK